MKKENLKKGYRLAKVSDIKEGTTYFLLRQGDIEASRRVHVEGSSDFQKWLDDETAEVFVKQEVKTTTTTTKK